MAVTGTRSEWQWLALASLPGLYLCCTMPVFAQEAYYWTYAQHPDCSYFDHPPMVAWAIWIGTHLFGNGALGVRFVTWLCGVGTLALGLALLRSFGANERARKAWLLFASASPVLLATRFLANPDPPLCLFWLGTMTALWRARSGSLLWWIAAGACAGAALLSKYTGAFLGLGGLLLLAVDRDLRRQLLRPGPWIGVVTAVLVFLPVVLWNVHNDFASFRFQTSERFARASVSPWCVLRYVGEQFGLLHPLLSLMLPAAVLWLWRRSRIARPDFDARTTFLLAFGLPMPLFFLANSLGMTVKPNWVAPAYLPLLLGLAWWWSESGLLERRPVLATRVSRILAATIPIVLLAPIVNVWPQHRGSSWTGWSEVADAAEKWEERVDPEDQKEGNVFFFAADYKDAAQLTHGLCQHEEQHPEEPPIEPVLAQNALGRPALQFDQWERPQLHEGQDAIFVLPRADERQSHVEEARAHFASIEKVERVDVERLGIRVMSADIYVCRDYKGPLTTPR